jgi:hypothetical protein
MSIEQVGLFAAQRADPHEAILVAGHEDGAGRIEGDGVQAFPMRSDRPLAASGQVEWPRRTSIDRGVARDLPSCLRGAHGSWRVRVFAAEVRSEEDYGPAAEKRLAQKRSD